MASKELNGMFLMAGASLLATALVNMSTLIQQTDLPYFALLGLSTFFMAIVLGGTGGVARLCRMPRRQWKWVFIRGFAGASRQWLTLLAISTGAPMGDISALQSINVVVAAVFGRLILGEPMRRLHVAALCFSVAGAVLISKPTTLIGLGDADSEPHWFGYGLALLGGIASGGIFIAARKLQGVNQVVPLGSVFTHQTLCLWILSFSGLANDPPPLKSIAAAPLACLGVCIMALLANGFSTVMMSLGGTWCPAAASSTIFTSVGMTVSYIFQVMLQGQNPDLMSVGGALLMFAAVVIMAFARWYYEPNAPAVQEEAKVPGTERPKSVEATEEEEEDDESFVTFIASEFSGISETSAARQRRLRQVVTSSPQIIGLAVA